MSEKVLKTLKSGLRYKGSIPTPKKARATSIKMQEEPMVVHGRPVDSKEEYYVAKALDILGWDYYYQFMVGTRGVRGTQTLDFVVMTPGKWTILDVRGRYWHTGAREDGLDIERVARRKGWRLVVAWDNDVPGIKEATMFVRKEIGGQ